MCHAKDFEVAEQLVQQAWWRRDVERRRDAAAGTDPILGFSKLARNEMLAPSSDARRGQLMNLPEKSSDNGSVSCFRPWFIAAT